MSDPTTQQSSASTYQSLLPLNSEYPTAIYVISPILITYFGIYVMLRNHYIFKPKIQTFLKKARIKSAFAKEFMIDLLLSLSIFTFVLSSLLLSYSDQAIQLIVHHDLYWVGLCVSVLVYRNIRQQTILEMKVIIKNAILLLLSYALIVFQYFSGYSFLLMGLLLMAIYVINIFFKIYEANFVKLIQDLFNSKHLEIGNVAYNHVNNMESPEFLATHFPVTRQELEERLHPYEPHLKKLKLKTKIAVTKKLLMLSLAVRLSQQKMFSKMKRDVGAYYGGLNGTTNQKVKRLDYEAKNTLTQEMVQREGTNQSVEQEVIVNGLDVDDELQVLFTIFPVKIFESSTIISIIFSVFLNLSFGVCLDYTLSVTSTLKFGSFLNNLYAFIILPILPNISKAEYFNSMTLFSIWKYFLVGLFVSLNVLVNGSAAIQTSSVLQIQVIFVIIMIFSVMGYLLMDCKYQYRLFALFFVLFAANLGASFKGSHRRNVQ